MGASHKQAQYFFARQEFGLFGWDFCKGNVKVFASMA